MEWLRRLEAENDHVHRLKTDLPYFAETSLKLRPKIGSIAPFVFNPAQLRLHEIIEAQKAKTGRVRVVVLKARQLGISSYVAARFYHKTINSPGLRTIIIGHEKGASSNLFQIVKRFHDHVPDDMRLSIGTSNAEELVFDKIDSGYLVTVATLEGAVQSATSQKLNASEVAFWPDLPAQMASLMQTVPDMDGTEVILESTANSFNDFFKLWRKAEAGESEFIPVFLPWSLAPEYRGKPDADFTMSADEKQLAERHKLDVEQICWRRAKISQLGDGLLFPQEYPLTSAEAFIAAQFDSFIPAELVLRARNEIIAEDGPLVIGVDPAGMGADATAIAWRQGSAITKVEKRRGLDTMQTVGWVVSIINEDKPARVNIDVSGMGVGIYDRLREQRYDVVQAVNFGGKPVDPGVPDETGRFGGGPANRRAEIWLNLRSALEGRMSLPDTDSLQADLTSVGFKHDSVGRVLLESKQDMRRRGVPSPDEGDAVALCFADRWGPPPSNFYGAIDFPKQVWV